MNNQKVILLITILYIASGATAQPPRPAVELNTATAFYGTWEGTIKCGAYNAERKLGLVISSYKNYPDSVRIVLLKGSPGLSQFDSLIARINYGVIEIPLLQKEFTGDAACLTVILLISLADSAAMIGVHRMADIPTVCAALEYHAKRLRKGSAPGSSMPGVNKLVDARATPSPKFMFDKAHKPYRYARVIADKKGYAISNVSSPLPPGTAVGILDFKAKTVFRNLKTTTSQQIALDDFNTKGWVTYLNGRPASSNSYMSMIAMVGYTGQEYSSVLESRNSDKSKINSLHQLIVSARNVQLFLDNLESEGEDKVTLSVHTPEIYSLNTPGLSAFVACYRSISSMEMLPYMAIVLIINGKAYPVTGSCSNLEDVYKFGDNYFIRCDWEPCADESSKSVIYEIRDIGIVKEAEI